MEWLLSRWRPIRGRSQWFVLLMAGLLVGVFVGTITTSTPPVFAQAPDDSTSIEETINSGGALGDGAVTVDGGAVTEAATGALEEATSDCNIAQVGWIVCGITMFIANGMDWIYSALTNFLTVQPLEVTNRSSAFYQAWDIMRGIANIAFIIVFLIIVYSQVSSVGISNYGIKKLAPRLIITAILVNLSFMICAVFIDISNITGVALQDMFSEMTKSLMATGQADNSGIGSIADIAQTFLAGTALTAWGINATGGSITAAAPFFVPLLAMLFLALLVALLVMAARQALVIILTVIAPLAFVCYLLPGTEKWFEKWRSTFITMIVFFPAFAVVFGGSQLAGMLIMANANTVVMFILGITIQLAPLAITPVLLKLGGGILNRFAGIVNDPAKGMVDKSRQWAQKKSKTMSMDSYDKMQNRREAWRKNGRRGGLAGRMWFGDTFGMYGGTRRMARDFNNRSRLLNDQAEEAEKRAENIYHDSGRYKRHDLKSRHTADRAELLSQKATNRYDEMKGGKVPTDIAPTWIEKNIIRTAVPGGKKTIELTNDTQVLFEDIAVQGFRKTNNQRQLNQIFTERMAANESLQRAASGIYGNASDGYQKGTDAALASAITAMRNDYGKSVEEGAQIVKHFNLSSSDRQAHALGATVRVQDGSGNWRTFDSTNTFTREAVIEEQIAVGTVTQVKEIVQQSGSALAEFKTTISAAVAKSGVKGKAPFIGGKLIDDIAKGAITSEDALIGYIQDWIADGKFRDEDIAITDPDGLKLLMQAARSSTSHMTPTLQAQMTEGLAALSQKAENALNVDDLKQHVSKKAEPFMEKISRGDFTP